MPPKQNQQLTVKLQTSRGKELSRSGTPQDVHDGTGAPEEPIEAGQRRSLSVPRHLDVRRLVVAGVDKRGRALKPFESLHDASRERSARIRTLRCTGDARDGELRRDSLELQPSSMPVYGMSGLRPRTPSRQ